jgi:hypothetical protein
MSAGTAHVRLLAPGAPPRPNPVLEFSKGFPLKGLCHEMNNFFEGPNSKISKISKTFMYTVCADGFNFFWCLVLEKMNIQAFACFYKNTY